MVEPDTETCMTDFYRKPYADIDSIEAHPAEMAFAQPVNYWDNDDGFWDEYLDDRQLKMQNAGLISSRKFIKH